MTPHFARLDYEPFNQLAPVVGAARPDQGAA